METGLYHYRKRAYSPELGRFLQTDPVGYDDDVNLYRYVRNNPLRYLDPMGLKARTVWGNWYDFVNSDPILSDIGEWGVGFGESIVGLKDLPRSIGTFVMHPVATVKAIPGAVQQTIENLSDSDTAPRAIGQLTGDIVIAVTTARAVKAIKQVGIADDVINAVDKAEDIPEEVVGSIKQAGPADDIISAVDKVEDTTKGFKPGKWLEHFEKHGSEFGSTNSVEYLKSANKFIQSSSATKLIKVDSTGITRMYDLTTNEFLSINPDGSIRTYFKPIVGIDYWTTQP